MVPLTSVVAVSVAAPPTPSGTVSDSVAAPSETGAVARAAASAVEPPCVAAASAVSPDATMDAEISVLGGTPSEVRSSLSNCSSISSPGCTGPSGRPATCTDRRS